jgi:hypothetical protein
VESPERFAWLAASVQVNETDGSVWVVEHVHPQVPGCQERVIICDADGRMRKEIEMAGAGVAVDAAHGAAWVSSWAGGLSKLTLAGKIVKTIPVRGSAVAVEPDTGCVWVAGTDGVYRLDSDGRLLWEKPGGKSGKWLAVVGEQK